MAKLSLLWLFITAVISFSPAALGATATQPPTYSIEELWGLQTKFWDAFLYPANVNETRAINSTIFTPDLCRVDVTRVFNGSELNTEYIFGLFSDPDHFGLFGIPISYSITQFSGNGNIASVTAVVTFKVISFGGFLVPVTIDTWSMWDTNGQIEQYDSTFRWFGFLLDTLIETLATQQNTTTTQATTFLSQAFATAICKTHDQYCTGDNQQYTIASTCYKFLTEDIPFGKDYEIGMNTLLCREVHEYMVRFDPDMHCPHIGPSGGEYCVNDQTYAQKVLQKYFRKSWLAYGPVDQDIWLGD
ncbi:hypothetical protein BO71DRAFT_383817 [Aspergillus ellipticus CBS 707.79]|uniref:Uncharacterized protein n=1 Tax=Aspergillus ellipticus CBS 707.79 TaxID=1448320 RepID=A0A319D499_9EURO|nr:hypothetical protein BO71DRAFT_383817 [Aspergillus ellipticus CBS 707.79]